MSAIRPAIMVWLEVRILSGPPGSPSFAEISWRRANSPGLVGLLCSRSVSGTAQFVAGATSLGFVSGLHKTVSRKRSPSVAGDAVRM